MADPVTVELACRHVAAGSAPAEARLPLGDNGFLIVCAPCLERLQARILTGFFEQVIRAGVREAMRGRRVG